MYILFVIVFKFVITTYHHLNEVTPSILCTLVTGSDTDVTRSVLLGIGCNKQSNYCRLIDKSGIVYDNYRSVPHDSRSMEGIIFTEVKIAYYHYPHTEHPAGMLCPIWT